VVVVAVAPIAMVAKTAQVAVAPEDLTPKTTI
jgi:hypothetical protein